MYWYCIQVMWFFLGSIAGFILCAIVSIASRSNLEECYNQVQDANAALVKRNEDLEKRIASLKAGLDSLIERIRI